MKITKETWIQAQASVLGCCLIEEKCAAEIVFGLREDDFASEYRPLYRAIVDLYTTGKPVDPITVMHVVGSEYRETIRQLMEITPSAANIRYYIRITAEQSRVLHMRDVGLRLMDVDGITEAQEIMDSANGALVSGNGLTAISLKNLLSNWFTRYANPAGYYNWFIPQMRRLIRLKKANYMIIGARPSVGKSAFAMQAAAFWAVACGLRVGFYSDEMCDDELTDRLVSMCAGVQLEDVMERRISEKQIQAVAAIAAKISEAPLYVIPASGHPVSDIRANALKMHLDIIIIDYLQIVPERGEKEYDRVTRVSHELQKLCKSTGITVLALSQLDRLRGARPTLEDLRSSGQLEQDADIVAFLHRPQGQSDTVEFVISKNRNGKLGTTKLEFDGGLQRFLYVGKGDKPLKAFDYSAVTYRPDVQDLSQMTVLPDDTPVPF
ncbi:MAG: replicative DNA helicase [Faecousia sp.]